MQFKLNFMSLGRSKRMLNVNGGLQGFNRHDRLHLTIMRLLRRSAPRNDIFK